MVVGARGPGLIREANLLHGRGSARPRSARARSAPTRGPTDDVEPCGNQASTLPDGVAGKTTTKTKDDRTKEAQTEDPRYRRDADGSLGSPKGRPQTHLSPSASRRDQPPNPLGSRGSLSWPGSDSGSGRRRNVCREVYVRPASASGPWQTGGLASTGFGVCLGGVGVCRRFRRRRLPRASNS